MPTVYANSGDGRISSTTTTLYARARIGNIDGVTTVISGENSSDSLIGWQGATAASKSITYTLYRSYYYFDFSSVGNVDTATFSIYGLTYGALDCRIVKSTAFGGDGGTALAASDWNAIYGHTSNLTMAGNVTDYASELGTWSTSGYNTFNLNGSAIGDLNKDGRLIICLVDADWDYSGYGANLDGGVSPPFSANEKNGGYFSENTGTSKDPKIDYVLSTPYGNNVNGVASANIGKVNGRSTFIIEKVIGA